jgi:hypothetical protein
MRSPFFRKRIIFEPPISTFPSRVDPEGNLCLKTETAFLQPDGRFLSNSNSRIELLACGEANGKDNDKLVKQYDIVPTYLHNGDRRIIRPGLTLNEARQYLISYNSAPELWVHSIHISKAADMEIEQPDLTTHLAHLLFDPDTYIISFDNLGHVANGIATQAGKLPDLQKLLGLINQEIQAQPKDRLASKLLQTDDFGLSCIKVLQYLIEEDKKLARHLPHAHDLYETLNLLWAKTQDPRIWLDYLAPAVSRSTWKHGIICSETSTDQVARAATPNHDKLLDPDPKLTLLIRLAGVPAYQKILREQTRPPLQTLAKAPPKQKALDI